MSCNSVAVNNKITTSIKYQVTDYTLFMVQCGSILEGYCSLLIEILFIAAKCYFPKYTQNVLLDLEVFVNSLTTGVGL